MKCRNAIFTNNMVWNVNRVLPAGHDGNHRSGLSRRSWHSEDGSIDDCLCQSVLASAKLSYHVQALSKLEAKTGVSVAKK